MIIAKPASAGFVLLDVLKISHVQYGEMNNK